MRLRATQLRPGRLSFTVAVCALGVWCSAVPISGKALAVEGLESPVISAGADFTEVTFPAPRLHGLFLHSGDKVWRLYAVGDVIMHPESSSRALVVERVDANGMELHETPSGQRRSLQPGNLVPGYPGLIYLRSVLLEQVEYRLKVVTRVTQGDPILLSLAGPRAVLEKQISPVEPGSQEVESERTDSSGEWTSRSDWTSIGLDQIAELAVEEIDENNYEVHGAMVMPMVEQVAHWVPQVMPNVGWSFSTPSQTLPVTSKMVDGTLSGRGFTVTRPRVARALGIHVGDTVTTVNGRAVSNPWNAWSEVQELIHKSRDIDKVHIELVREGRVMTKTVRIR